MKNHFVLSYVGNKREEVEIIHNNIINNLENITTIIEPFCGSSAFSYYISTIYPKRFTYILNDNDEMLIQLYNTLKNENLFNLFIEELKEKLETLTREEYYDNNKDKNLLWYFIKRFIFYIRAGTFPLIYDKDKALAKANKIKICPIINFLRNENIEIRNEDGIRIYEEFKNNNQNLIFLDPPYILSDNTLYKTPNIDIYKYLFHNNFKNEESQIILVLEYMWIISLLFKDCNIYLYDKRYQMAKKKRTQHAIIKNKD
jgi:site-specific DNA-adenine methylase